MRSSIAPITVLAGFVSLAGCIGGSSSDDNGSEQAGGTQTGIFVDGVVININYQTETESGVTNELGEFDYQNGETVTFSIGDLEFPPVDASELVTPLDMADTDEISDPMVVNILRLLQSLDEDGDPDNGITITEKAKNNATQVDFELSVEDFGQSTAVTTLVANSGSSTIVLIPAEDATEHFENSLDQNFRINMRERTASSVVTFSACPDVPGGWDYSFTDTTLTLSGTDGWQTPECTLKPMETLSLNMSNLASDFDLPFNCKDYPLCTVDDFEKVLSGEDEDDREFTSTYTFDRATLTMTHEKSIPEEISTFTEVITIE